MRSGWSGPACVLIGLTAPCLRAQTIEDGLLLPRKTLVTGVLYSHDSWDHYWEGTLKRVNGNIGTVTTQTAVWSGSYGVSNRLNLIANVPFVSTAASQGVLQGMSGLQDLTLAAKYRLLETPFTEVGSIRAIAVLSGSIPLSRYTPDFQPLSIGLASKRVSGRFTADFRAKLGWFLTGSTAYTWRGKVTLDRPYYYTDGQLFLSNEVAMPDVFNYNLGFGYSRGGLMVPITFAGQRTLGGGDCRRQDMPFVSNRMNFSKVNAIVMYQLPKIRNLSTQFAYGYTIDGRNVGQGTTLTMGLLYTLSFGSPTTP
jgi:Putative MetA-pathway of phenol degradation